MVTTTITPHKFFKELKKHNYGLRHIWSLVRVLKHYGHCYCNVNGEKSLFIKRKRENILLTNEQKQEIINLYWDDFYAMNIINWFSETYPKEVKQALKQTLKYYDISWHEWKKACKAVECFDCDASELTEEVELHTMNILLEKANVDPYETYNSTTKN